MSNAATRRHAHTIVLAGFALAALPALARAEVTDEQREACAPDAFRLCRDTIPDIAKTTACMKAHVADLTPRCRAAFNEAVAPAPKVAEAPTSAQRRRKPRAVAASPTHQKQARQEQEGRVHNVPGATAARAPGAGDETAAAPAMPAPAVAAPAAGIPALGVPAIGGPNLAPPRLPGLAGYRAHIAHLCHEGLIDAFTCHSTLQALSLSE